MNKSLPVLRNLQVKQQVKYCREKTGRKCFWSTPTEGIQLNPGTRRHLCRGLRVSDNQAGEGVGGGHWERPAQGHGESRHKALQQGSRAWGTTSSSARLAWAPGVAHSEWGVHSWNALLPAQLSASSTSSHTGGPALSPGDLSSLGPGEYYQAFWVEPVTCLTKRIRWR